MESHSDHSEPTWFLGPKGAETVGFLTSELFEQSKRIAEEHFERSFDSYVPWMSNPERLGAFAELAKGPTVALPPVLFDPQTIETFSKAFGMPGAPLGELTNEGNWSQDFFRGTEEENRQLGHLLLTAKRNVMALSPVFQRRFETLNHTIVPIQTAPTVRTGRAAFSSHEMRGAIFMEPPDTDRPFWEIILEIDLVHELGHTALITYQSADPIFESSGDEPIYSAIRKVNRPAIMSFHAAAALAYMLEYIETALAVGRYQGPDRQFVELELASCRKDLAEGLEALKTCKFTPLGQKIYDEFRQLSERASI